MTILRRARRRLVGWSVLAAVLLIASPRSGEGQFVTAREYDVKAGFLYNFATLVDWPEGTFKSESDDLRLEVIGHDFFDGALDRLVAGKTVNRHRVVVGYASRLSDAPPAPMVFISASERDHLPEILRTLHGAPTLTVSDMDRFADQGGMIGLVMDRKSVRFVINRAAANRARMHISSMLLSLATILDRDALSSIVAGPGGQRPTP